jgi:hypothetical protein
MTQGGIFMNLLGRLTDTGFWESVRNDEYYVQYINEIKASWDELCEDAPIAPLNYRDYRLFEVTGDRDTYQRPYFKRRGALNAAAILSLIYPEEEKYFVKLQDTIFDICSEYTWCLPAHLGHTDGKSASEIVDLFAAETGFSLAEIYIVHEKRLDDFIKRIIRENIERRIIKPTFERPDGWWWEHMNNNWLSVCAGSVGCTTMLLYPEAFRQLKPRFDSAMERYIDSFLGEGMCLEGCSYWDYGFGFFTVYADMLKSFTEGKEDYFKRQDVREIAAFPQRMFLTGNVVVSFSDMGTTYLNSVGIIHYLKSVYPDTVKLPKAEYCTYGIKRWRTSYIIRAAAWAKKEYSELDEIGNDTECFYAKKSQWYINKREKYSFAAKAGNNGEPHNHNDVGHFIYAKDGKQILVDLGAGLYDKKYFSKERYSVFEASSRSHSVPIIGDELQKFGKEYAARDVVATDNSFSMEISGAYGNNNLASLKRKFDLLEDGIVLTDEFELKEEVAISERFVSLIEPTVISDGRIEIGSSALYYDPTVCVPTVKREKSSIKECYLIDFVLETGVRKFSVEIK